MKTTRIIVIILHLFVGLGALAGGTAAIMTPSNPLGMPAEALQYSPFQSFLIPGIILFTFIGLFNLISGILVIIRKRFNEYLPGLTGIIMALWLIVQCLILRDIHYLHITFFIIAIIQGSLSIYLLYNRNLFPFNF